MRVLKKSFRIAYLLAVEIIGWILLIAGVAALVLPGPGVLLMFSGIVVLSTRYAWAGHLRHKAEGWVVESTKASVQTKTRIFFSLATASVAILLGVIVMFDPTLPSYINWDFDLKLFELSIGPKIPGANLPTGIMMVVSGFIALGLIIFGVVKYKD